MQAFGVQQGGAQQFQAQIGFAQRVRQNTPMPQQQVQQPVMMQQGQLMVQANAPQQIQNGGQWQVQPQDVQRFKEALPLPFGAAGSVANYGLGLAITGYNRELLGIQPWRSFTLRNGQVMTSVSFSPEGVCGVSHFDDQQLMNLQKTRLICVAVDAEWVTGIAGDHTRVTVVPKADWEFHKTIFELLPWGCQPQLQQAAIALLRDWKSGQDYQGLPFSCATDLVDAPPTPTADANIPAQVAQQNTQMMDLMRVLTEQVTSLQEKVDKFEGQPARKHRATAEAAGPGAGDAVHIG